MTEYRRAWQPGGTWFFTVNLAERRGNRLLVERIELLRAAYRRVRTTPLSPRSGRGPTGPSALRLDAAAWGYGLFYRWNLIKGDFSRAIEKGERVSHSRTIGRILKVSLVC